ncbi:MAG: type II toxin-antitoxin system VapC family toxin [Caulobacteraceae bacterium]
MRGPAPAREGSILLDTCALVWLSNGDPISEAAREAVAAAARQGGVLASPVSAWEVGLLAERGEARFLPDPEAWFARLMTAPGIAPAPLDWRISLAASSLPEPFPGDVADRLLFATARLLAVPLLTRDARLIAYSIASGPEIIEC